MIPFETLDAEIARLDLALLRFDGLPHDPVAAHELVFCLVGLASQDLPSGLGAELDELLQQAMCLATQVQLSLCQQLFICPRPALPSTQQAGGRLRSKLLDIAAAISVRADE